MDENPALNRSSHLKPRVAVHKFSSCDGCQLALLNAGETLLGLSDRVDLVHFAEAGPVNPEAEVDIALIEGSLSTQEDRERIVRIRARSQFVITMGACATAGGIQALRNFADGGQWLTSIYAHPEYISSLDHVTPIRDQIHVDLELWGCPVNSRQVFTAIGSLLAGAPPVEPDERVCLECKRQKAVCVLVTKGDPCLGPVTRTGCGALCPRFGRDCYGCYGPGEHPNTTALGRRFAGLGLIDSAIARRFWFINSQAPEFKVAGEQAEEYRP